MNTSMVWWAYRIIRTNYPDNWTVDALDYGSFDEMYQAFHFYQCCVHKLAMASFSTPPFGVSSILVQISLSLADGNARQWVGLLHYLWFRTCILLRTYTQLTGRMLLPSMLGAWLPSMPLAMNLKLLCVSGTRIPRRSIPRDVIYLDIDYMRGYRVFTWSPKRFPNPATLIWHKMV